MALVQEDWEKLRQKIIVESQTAVELFHAFQISPSQWVEAAKMLAEKPAEPEPAIEPEKS
jgi:hypothetical protein